MQNENNNIPIARPPRRAKTQALQYIRENAQRVEEVRTNPILQVGEDDEYLSSDSDDSEYSSNDETASISSQDSLVSEDSEDSFEED